MLLSGIGGALSSIGKSLTRPPKKKPQRSIPEEKKQNPNIGFDEDTPASSVEPKVSLVPFIPLPSSDRVTEPQPKTGKTLTSRARLVILRKKVVRIEKLLDNRSRYVVNKRQEQKDKAEERARQLKERKAEAKNKNKKGPVATAKKSVGNIFDRIIQGIGLVFLGWILNQIDAIIKAFQALRAGFEKIAKLLKPIVMPIFNFLKWFVKEGLKLVGGLMGADIEKGDSVLEIINEIDKKIPILNALFAALAAAQIINAVQGWRRGWRNTPDLFNRRKGGRKPWWRRGKGSRTGGDWGPRRGRNRWNPFRRNPITRGSNPLSRFLSRLNPLNRKVTGGKGFWGKAWEGTKNLGRRAWTGTTEGIKSGIKKGGELIDWGSQQYRKVTTALRSKLDEIIEGGSRRALTFLQKQDGLIGRIGRKLPDFLSSSQTLLKKFGKYLPFVGDVVGFVIDLASGIDWRRALMRAVAGVSIDAGFTALMAALGLAAPFTGGASGILATALYAAYMGADVASGGFGRKIGDMISDAFGWPMMAGQKDAPDPGKPGSENDIKKLEKFFDKKAKEDPKFAKKVKLSDAAAEPKETKIPNYKPKDGPPPVQAKDYYEWEREFDKRVTAALYGSDPRKGTGEGNKMLREIGKIPSRKITEQNILDYIALGGNPRKSESWERRLKFSKKIEFEQTRDVGSVPSPEPAKQEGLKTNQTSGSTQIKPVDNNKASSTASSISSRAPYDGVGKSSIVPFVLPGSGKGNTQVPVQQSASLPTGSLLNSGEAVLNTVATTALSKN